jgi:hypothetical protein
MVDYFLHPSYVQIFSEVFSNTCNLRPSFEEWDASRPDKATYVFIALH